MTCVPFPLRRFPFAALLTSCIASGALTAAVAAQVPRQYDAAVFENAYLRVHVATLNAIGHYRTAPDVPQIVYCLGSVSVSGEDGPRERCAKDQLLFVEPDDRIELRADGDPRPEALIVEIKRPPSGEYVGRQDEAVRAAPDVYRLLLENGAVRVLRIALKPGARTKPHWHPGGTLLYPFRTAQTRETVAGRTRVVPWQAGVPRWTDAEIRHEVENAGTTEGVAILVELK